MRRTLRSVVLFSASVTAALGLAAIAALSCSSSAKAVGEGGECFQATDCDVGLVCVPLQGGRHVCSKDISGIVHSEDAGGPTDAPVVDATRDGATDGAPADTGGNEGAPPVDSGGGNDAAVD